MKLDKKSLKKMFPNLAKELLANENRVQVNSVRIGREDQEKEASSQNVDCYVPDVIDFIRRCDTNEQAKEIIDYMSKRGQIDEKYAEMLRKQLKERGVRSFGSKKEQDYYLKHAQQ